MFSKLICAMVALSLSRGEKPFTLKVPMLNPLGGFINPMGPVCTESINLALEAVNNNPKILPNYKLLIDIADDECLDVTALRRAVSFFENLKPKVPVDKVYGDMILPPNSTNSGGVAYVPPLFLGGQCTAVCKGSARLPQHFNYIDVVAGCNDPLLTERSRYPNLYRFSPSLVEHGAARIKLMEYLGWNKIAILSDTVQSSYSDSLYFMRRIQSNPEFSISMEQFFINDPSESIARMKAADVRIIVASCYVNTCPTIACSAYQQGFYGPRIVWIFNTMLDLLTVNLVRPKGCTKEMTDAFAEYTLYIGSEVIGNLLSPDTTSDSGISFKQFNEYMAAKVPNLEKSPAYSWRITCFEHATIAAHILDSTERRLNLANETLKDVITQPERAHELSELIRTSTLTINAKTLWGPVGFLPGTTEPLSPVMVVEQVYRGIRKTALTIPDRTVSDGKKAFHTVRNLVWGTPDGSTPLSEPATASRALAVPSGGVYAVYFVHILLILAMWLVVGVNMRSKGEIGPNEFRTHNIISAFGATVILATIFTFPPHADATSQTFDHFCAISLPMLIMGMSILSAPLIAKLWQIRRHNKSGGSKKSAITWLLIASWLLLNIGVLIAWYYGGTRTRSVTLTVSKYKALEDTIWTDMWQSCTTDSWSFLVAILTLQGAFLISGIFPSIKVKSLGNNNHAIGTSVDLFETSYTLYTAISVTFVAIFALVVFHSAYGALFAILIVFGAVNSLGVTLVLYRSTILFLLKKSGICQSNHQRLGSSVVPIYGTPNLNSFRSLQQSQATRLRSVRTPRGIPLSPYA